MKRIIGDDRARLLSKIDMSGGPDACWPFTHAVNGHGYATFYRGGKYNGAHRAAWELMVGPIPPGMQVDHVCHNADLSCPGGDSCPHRRCLNWGRHLRLVTHLENGLSGRTGHKTHCPRGHEYNEENTYVWARPGGSGESWNCRACRRRDGAERVRKMGPLAMSGEERRALAVQRAAGVAERRARAIDLRSNGLTYDQIARDLGYANKSAARNLINGPRKR